MAAVQTDLHDCLPGRRPADAADVSGTQEGLVVRIDLHVHSNASDGTDAPAEVVRRAQRRGSTWWRSPTTTRRRASPRPVPRCRPASPWSLAWSCPASSDGRSVHLLAYLFDPEDPALRAETSPDPRRPYLPGARRWSPRCGNSAPTVTWEQVSAIADGAVVGRPHLARALAASGAVARPGRRVHRRLDRRRRPRLRRPLRARPCPRCGAGPGGGRRPRARASPLAGIRDPGRGHRRRWPARACAGSRSSTPTMISRSGCG